MTSLRAIRAIAAFTLGVVLTLGLVRLSALDLHEALVRLALADRTAFLFLCALMGLNAYLSSRKWQLVDRVLRERGDPALNQSTSFWLTAVGVALGQILPVQVAVSLSRSLGARFSGRPFQRGTLGTLFEQGFDVLVASCLALAATANLLWHGNTRVLLALLSVGSIIAIVAGGLSLHIVARLTKVPALARMKRLRHAVAGHEGLLVPKLGFQLSGLSVARFTVLVLMAGQTTRAIRLDLPLWHLAAAMPWVLLGNVLSITPGGLGVVEVTYSAVLKFSGIPVAVAAQWAISNRLLTFFASIFVALAASLLHWILRLSKNPAAKKKSAAQKGNLLDSAPL